jgi:hypothetical protein
MLSTEARMFAKTASVVLALDGLTCFALAFVSSGWEHRMFIIGGLVLLLEMTWFWRELAWDNVLRSTTKQRGEAERAAAGRDDKEG